MLLSLAGIPVTAGFIGKFYIVAASASSALWALVIILVMTSVVGLFYYLRLIAVMYAALDSKPASIAPAISFAGGVVLATLTALLLWFGTYPEPLLRAIRAVFLT